MDKLLTMLRTMDPARDNLADNEEIQVCRRSLVDLRGAKYPLAGTVPVLHVAPA